MEAKDPSHFATMYACINSPCDGPGFDSRWVRCINRASHPSQGTVNGGAVSKLPRCRRDVKINQPTNQVVYQRASAEKMECRVFPQKIATWLCIGARSHNGCCYSRFICLKLNRTVNYETTTIRQCFQDGTHPNLRPKTGICGVRFGV